jgi:HEAT repeat protein/uncharacterized RDD family membrane protein YckC
LEPISLTEPVTTDVPGPHKRVFGFLVDGVTFSLVFSAFRTLSPRLAGSWEIFLWSGYFLLRDVAGGSLGKRLTGLTIVDSAGRPAGAGSLILRNVPVAIPLVVIAEYFVMKGSSQGQRWGDRWAGTRVQDKRPHVSDGVFFWYGLGLIVLLLAMRAFAGNATMAAGQEEVAEAAEQQSRPLSVWIDLLADNKQYIEAERAIRAAGASAAPALSNAVLTHVNPAVRAAAARLLGMNGGPGSVAVLIKALKHPDPDVRVGAASGLFFRGTNDDPETATAVSPLTEAIKDPETRVRIDAADALKSIGPLAKAAAPALLAALQNSDDKALYALAAALERVDAATARQHAIPLIVRAYDREDGNTRFLLISVLGDLKAPPEAVIPTYIRALDEEDNYPRERAALLLGEIGAPAAAAIPKLTSLLKHKDEDTRAAAATAIALIRGKK